MSLEGLLLIHQEFKESGRIEIESSLIELYKELKIEMNKKKEKKRTNNEISINAPEQGQEQSIMLLEPLQTSNQQH